MSKRMYVLFVILLNSIVPWGLYVWLSQSMSNLAALSIATLVPLLDNVVHLLRHRKLDAFGSLMLFTFLLTIALVSLGGSEKLLLLRESLITAAVGIVFLVSLVFPKPLMFHLSQRFIGTPDYAGNWRYVYFRSVMRRMTLMWGGLLAMEAAVKVLLVFKLSTAQFLVMSNLVLYGFVGTLIAWTFYYRRHSSRRLAQIKLQSEF